MSGFDSFHGMLATCNFITVKRKGTHCTWSVLEGKKFKYKYKYKYIDFEIIKYKYKYKYGNFEQVQVQVQVVLVLEPMPAYTATIISKTLIIQQ